MPRSAHFSSTARASENSNPIAPHTRFHASARARPGLFRLSKILCRGQHFLAQQLAHQRIQTQSLHTLDSMQVRVRGLGSHARHATPRAARVAPRRWRWPAGRWPRSSGSSWFAHRNAPCACYAHIAFVRVVLGSTATEPMIRSLVTQKAAPEAASGPAVLAIELGKNRPFALTFACHGEKTIAPRGA